jgi:calcineurin-like phosphoesterase family protein
MVCRKFNGIRFHMTHYPIASWSGKEHGSVHLYGHCHSRLEDKLDIFDPGRKSMDVGMDNAFRLTGQFTPFAITDIFNRLRVLNADSRDC